MAKYCNLSQDPKTMERAHLQAIFDGKPWSMVMRSLLMFEVKRVRQARENDEFTEERTLRNMWYRAIKPALDRWGALEKDFYNGDRIKSAKDYGKIPDWPGKMSKYLAELVRMGVTSYEELGIIDGSRPRQAPIGQSITVKDFDSIGAHHPNIFLFTEKDTIYPVVEKIADAFGIGVLSGSGEPSFAATENLVKKMIRHDNFVTGSNLYILTLTDYDPHGYKIARAAIQQVEDVVNGLKNEKKDVGTIYYERLGLTPDQMSYQERMENVYTPPKDAEFKRWFKETGGIDGQPLGLELDALSLSRIREIYVDGIKSIIPDEKPYHKDLARVLVDQLVWEGLESQIDKLCADLREKIDSKVLEESLSCHSDIIAAFAKSGIGYIDPVVYDEYIFNAADDIRQKIKQALNGGDFNLPNV